MIDVTAVVGLAMETKINLIRAKQASSKIG